MSFDSNSIELLRALGKKLPKSNIEKSPSFKLNQKSNSNLHPIETEQNPHKLFKELINASNDGAVPHHLIERLRTLEEQELKDKAIERNNSHSSLDNDDLYISFRQLLLEEEED